MNRIFHQYSHRASFYVVYIEEAHPTDLWQLPSNLRDNVLYESPRSDQERTEIASMCVVKLALELPALLDGIDNQTERAYTGWPDRLYVIGADRRIRFKSAPGPFGFSTQALEAALNSLD